MGIGSREYRGERGGKEDAEGRRVEERGQERERESRRDKWRGGAARGSLTDRVGSYVEGEAARARGEGEGGLEPIEVDAPTPRKPE